jgi:four helix bundle protein
MSNEHRVTSPTRKFEQLIAWQKAKDLAREVYFVSRQINFARDRRLVSQIQAAAVSVMSNIAEGYERDSAAEFHRFLVMAKASCAEVRSQLYLAQEVGHLERAEFLRILSLAEEVGRIVGGLKAAVKASRDK